MQSVADCAWRTAISIALANARQLLESRRSGSNLSMEGRHLNY
jgi:hypothetical protein